MLEHVPDPASIVGACAALTRPGGTVVVSTISRNLKAYALAVVAAEYVLGLLPKGTHDYAKFRTPAEVAAYARHAGLEVEDRLREELLEALAIGAGDGGGLGSGGTSHGFPASLYSKLALDGGNP